MLKRSRMFISATLVAVLFASTFILSSPIQSRACPVIPPPSTLLALYLSSDLIVAAEITGENDGKIINDYEQYYNVEVTRNLKISSALKGKPPADFAFTKTEYRSKTVDETEAVSDDEEESEYFPYGYKSTSNLRAGERYLFFFIMDAETGKYELTDHVSGAKNLNDYDLDVHKKRLKELQSIVKMKKNQVEALTAWLVRCVEEPSTRWDGVFDLNRSFEAIEYADEENKEEAFKLDKDFVTSPEIAKNLTDSQKEYLSTIAFSVLQQKTAFADNDNFYYSVSGLIKRWDRTRLAMYSFGVLQTIDKSDFEKTKAAMGYISEVIEDDKLTEIAERFPASGTPEEAEENTEENPEETNDAEPNDKSAVNPEDTLQRSGQTAETSTEKTEKAETPENAETKVSPKAKKPTVAEIREKVLQDFVNRYQFLVANGFQPEEEVEAEEEAETSDK